ncbi:MAG: hypothetical protein ACW986_10145 [Promethearchaeota archaeon]|jgi:hypothetical protein
MKKKTLLLFSSIIGLILISVFIYGTGRPGFGTTHDICHDNTGYTISTTSPGEIPTTVNSSFLFNITATGANLFVQAMPGAYDNDIFALSPTTDRINDTTIYDLDPNPNSILVTFNLTAPAQKGFYTIFIIAGNNASGSAINFAYAQIDVNVGAVARPGFDINNIFDHLGLYLGLPALLLVSLGTVLVLINESKFVRIHGILAGGSWVLTVVNLVAAITKMPINTWFGVYEPLYHIPHIIFGFVGLVAGFFSFLFGISAARKPAKISGYVTLACWWAGFLLGYFLNPNLLLL